VDHDNWLTLIQCPEGFYCPEGTKRSTQFMCPAGTYQPSLGATSLSDCLVCTAGFYCPEGSGKQFRCPPGSYCTAEFYDVADTTKGMMAAQGKLTPAGTKLISSGASSYDTSESITTDYSVTWSPIDCYTENQYCPVGSFRGYYCPAGFYVD
jgi:hypothetical protein